MIPPLRYFPSFDRETWRRYSYIGDDYPLTYPIGTVDTVALTLHESVHFALNASDITADQGWNQLLSFTKGAGRTHLGREHRLFVFTIFHQNHCLRRIQLALLNRDDPVATPEHVTHCLNYLRQTVMCEANDMLEKGDFMERDFDADVLGDTLICQDWERIFGVLDEKFEEWARWKKSWN